MAGPNLMMISIGLLALIAVVTLSYSAMNTLYDDILPVSMNDTMSSQYSGAASNITGQSGTISAIAQPESSLITKIFSAGVAVVTTAIIGVSAIFQLLGLLPVIQGLLQDMSTGPFTFTILIGFFAAAAGIYITMKVIKAIRGTNDEP